MADLTPNEQGKPKSSTIPKSRTPGQVVKDPDLVQKELMGIWGLVEAHWQFVVGGAGLLIAAAIVYSIVSWMGNRTEQKGQEAYYTVEAKYSKIKEGFDRAKYKALMPQAAAKDDKTEDKPMTGDLSKDYGTLVTDLEKVARDFAGTAAGAQAAILVADTYLSYNQADKAVEIASLAAKSLDEKHMLSALSRVVWGSALATKGDCKEAVKVWEQVINNKSVAFLHSDASLRTGLCFEAMNEPQRAKEMYQKVSSEGGARENSSSTTAKSLLRALELKTKAAGSAKQG